MAKHACFFETCADDTELVALTGDRKTRWQASLGVMSTQNCQTEAMKRADS